MNFIFFFNSILIGVGLAMDAFSVSVADALSEPSMKRVKMYEIAGTFAAFQFIMPLIGWFCIHNIAILFSSFEKFIPWIALALLVFIGTKMLSEGFEKKECCTTCTKLGIGTLIMQGVATSIDALSVGFTIAKHSTLQALVSCLLIAIVTFLICMGGLVIGKSVGSRFSGKACILGGIILIFIGLEIFITGIF